jgi:hypothetical protein
VTTDSNTFSSVFNTDYPGNQITGFQLNGVDIGSMITPFVDLSFSTANNYHYLLNNNNINTRFSFTKPKPRVAVTHCYRTYTYVDYTFYEFHTGFTGTFQLNTSIPNIVLDLNVLLIGGGGAGGHYSDSTSGGAGGGGAGSYVTTIIKAPATTSQFTSVYFNINVGAGGAGTNNGNTSGTNGSPSIIKYVSQSVFGNTNFSLTAAGGGSGGSKESPQGITNWLAINGSTGGACGNYGVLNVNASSTNAGYTNYNDSIFTNISCSVNRGGNTYNAYGGGGGGGAGGQGQDIGNGNFNGGNGGNGKTWINNVTYAGGGGGAKHVSGGTANSNGGSGVGGPSATLSGQSGDATQHTGSGGGAAWNGADNLSSGNGGSGICIIAVKTSDISL